MRYIVLVILGVFSVILNGSVFSALPFYGIQADILLLCVLSFALCERSVMPVVFALCFGLLQDALYSPFLGFFALGYTITAGAVCAVLGRFERINVITVAVCGALGALLNETVLTVAAYVLGARFSFSGLFKGHILPQAVFTAVALVGAYWLISKLMSPAYMKPRVKEKDRAEIFPDNRAGTPPQW